MCQSFGMSSAANSQKLQRCLLTLVYLSSSRCDTPLDADRYCTYSLPNDILTQKSMEVWLKAILPLENSSHLFFFPEKCKEDNLKCTLVHQVHTYIFSDMNFLLAYNEKWLERIALVSTCSIKVSNYITCFKILFSNVQSSGQPLTFYF